MDPFTKNLLERAEKRSKNLGLTNTSKFPLSDYNQAVEKASVSPAKTMNSSRKSPSKESMTSSTKSIASKITHSIQEACEKSTKENVDVAVEINITTSPNVQIQVGVEECQVDSQGNVLHKTDSKALIRDSSRKDLQRLGALYSDTQDLSSPIHRTEGRFYEEEQTKAPNNRTKNKLGKLAALAESINNWENDTINVKESAVSSKTNSENEKTFNSRKGTPTKKCIAPQPPTPKSILAPKKSLTESDKSPTKQLKWDQKVMNVLESQGYQRRESSTSKLVYDYNDDNIECNNLSSTKKLSVKKTKAPEIPDTTSTVKTNVPSIMTNSQSSVTKKTNGPQLPVKKTTDHNNKFDVSKGLVSERAAIFENANSSAPSSRNHKDPAEMSLKDRLAIFEKNKGTALIPKAAFGMSASIKQIGEKKPEPAKADLQKPKIQRYNDPVLAESNASGEGIRSTVAALMTSGSTISETKITEEVKKKRQDEMDVIFQRYHKPKTSENIEVISKPIPIAPPMPDFINKQHIEANCVVNNKRRSDGETSAALGKSCVSSDDIKRIRVAPPKAGKLYPALSDIESTESEHDNYTTATVSASEESEHYFDNRTTAHQQKFAEYEEDSMDSEDVDSSAGLCDISLGREILQAVKRNEEKSQHRSMNSTASEVSDVLTEMDDYLDEALCEDKHDNDEEYSSEDENCKGTPKKGSISSNSFSYERNPKQVHYTAIDEESEVENYREEKEEQDYRSPIKSKLTIEPSMENDMVTLVHTVSFYRRQQSSQSNTPLRKIQRKDNNEHQLRYNNNEENADRECSEATQLQNDKVLVQDKVKKLLDEVCKQQTVISQTSQALNLCAATIEFSGSTEAVEGERHLLVANHRRQAALDEVQRLRVEGCLRSMGAPQEKGRLTIKEITVPLKREYIRKLASDTICGHHLVCLLKYNETVLSTKTVLTLPGLLSVKFPDVMTLSNVYADFKITMEIYGMTAQREVLPHEVKYHIAVGKKGSNKGTPKNIKKGSESRLIMPPVQSPAGPQAVRTPALIKYGFIIFSLREIQRTSWQLNETSGGVNPLEGSVHMKVNCELSVSIDYRGFLTMYEVISGFGAWHRRWCRLNGHVLSYWKYPDDEKKKAPIGSIDMNACCSQNIAVAPRELCARLNTLLLECERERREDDEDSLIIVTKGDKTVVRYLLSADTKEERDEWSGHFNKTITLLRAWSNK